MRFHIAAALAAIVAPLLGCAESATDSNSNPPQKLTAACRPEPGPSSIGLQANDRGAIRAAADSRGHTIAGVDFRGRAELQGHSYNAGAWRHVAITKIDATGAEVWTRQFGSSCHASLAGLVVDRDDNILAVGTISGNTDLTGAPLRTTTQALFALKLNPSGQSIWTKTYQQDNTQLAAGAVGADEQGNVLIAGALEGTASFDSLTLSQPELRPFVLKLDRDARPLWATTLSGSADQHVTGIAADRTGSIFLGGTVAATEIGGVSYEGGGRANILVVKFSPEGSVSWVKYVGDLLDQTVSSLSVEPSGHVIVSGYVEGRADFGGVVLESRTGHDYEARFDNNGRAIQGRLCPPPG